MSEQNLPSAIRSYLETPSQDVGAELDELFSEDAVVHDDGHTHVGLASIRRWNDQVASAFSFTREIVEVLERGSGTVVRLRIEGDFPGSPIDLHHHFSLDGDKIAVITICT